MKTKNPAQTAVDAVLTDHQINDLVIKSTSDDPVEKQQAMDLLLEHTTTAEIQAGNQRILDRIRRLLQQLEQAS